jgi:membrane protein
MNERASNADIFDSSVIITYYLLLSFFPLLMMIGNLLPYFHINPDSFFPYMEAMMPEAIWGIAEPVIRDLLSNQSGGLLSLGLLGTFWAAGRAMTRLKSGINKAYGLPNNKSYVLQMTISILSLIVAIMLLAALLLVFSFGGAMINHLMPASLRPQTSQYMNRLKWPVAIAVLFGTILIIYHKLPNTKFRIRDALPGTVFATIGWLVLVRSFALYMHYSARTFSGYGALSAIFLLMFWMNFACNIVLFGAALNATIAELRFGSPKIKVHRVERLISSQHDKHQHSS